MADDQCTATIVGQAQRPISAANDFLAGIGQIGVQHVEKPILDRFRDPGALPIENVPEECRTQMPVQVSMIPAILMRAQTSIAGRGALAVFEQGQGPGEQGVGIARRRPDKAGAAWCRVVEKDLNLAAACAAFIKRRAMTTPDIRSIDVEQPCSGDAQRFGDRRQHDAPCGGAGRHMKRWRQAGRKTVQCRSETHGRARSLGLGRRIIPLASRGSGRVAGVAWR